MLVGMRTSRRDFSMMITGAALGGRLLGAEESQWVRRSTMLPVRLPAGFDSVGPMAKNLWIFKSLYDAGKRPGEDAFYITTFNSSDLGQLIRLDHRRNRAKAWTIPVGIGSWGLIRSRDGNLYMGSYNGGSLMCFDLGKETWSKLPQMDEEYREKESIICDLVEAPNNDIYYGTYPGCRLVRFDRDKGTLEDVGCPAPDENYLRVLRVTPGGVVLCGVATQRGRTVAYFPRERRFQTLTPPEYQQAGAASPIVTESYVTEILAGKIITYNARTLELSRVFDAPKGAGNFVEFEDDTLLYQQERAGLYRFGLRDGSVREHRRLALPPLTGRMYLTRDEEIFYPRVQSYALVTKNTTKPEWRRIPMDGLGQNIFWLNTFPDGRIFGGPELGQTLFAWDPKTHALASYDQVVDVSGEVYYGIPYENRLYTVSYVEATLAVFDPDKPWNQGNQRNSNPRTILRIPEHQYRPVGGIQLGPDGKMYIGTQPDYGMLGGALSVFDPKTERLEVFRNIVPDQQITAVAADAHWVYAAASPGGGGGAKPRAKVGHFFVWDPRAKKIVFDLPLGERESVHGLACAGGRTYFVAGKRFCEYDHATGKLRVVREFERSMRVPNQSFRAASDGTLWAVLNRSLVHIVPRESRVDSIPQTAGHVHGGLTIGLDGAVYFGCGTDMWAYRAK
jgi:hypothetical protein